MMKKISLSIQCKNCQGTGVYNGMGERGSCGVVCSTCDGTGCQKYEFEYEDFTERKPRAIDWVYEVNPGICIGNGNGHSFKDFGGMSYEDWAKGKPFPPKSENRKYTCPAWWYQLSDSAEKPTWKECGWGSFSDCEHFQNKSKCWERWDHESQGIK